MAQYLPAPPMHSPGGVPHQPDDGDVQTRAPSICVDYLSHTWEEEDVWASWRSITRRKNEVANGVRLENASWRTWWKQRNKLKTISPETLNWLKDSDVTWLYGPLHTAVEAVPPPKVATAEERLNLVSAQSGKKPILKHRTLSEILTTPMPSSPVLESLDFGDDVSDDSLGGPEKPYSLLQTKSDTNIFRRTSTSRKSSPYRGQTQPPLAQSPESEVPGGKKHISFNTFVEQCISLDEPTSISPDRPYEDDEDESEDDDVLEMRSSSSASSVSSKPSLSRQSSTEKEHFTIAHIAPARLKTTGNVEDDVNVVQHPSSASSHSGSSRYIPSDQSASSSGHGHGSSQGSDDFRSSIDAAGWDDDDDEFPDYFGGPGRGGAGGRSTAGGSVAASGVGSVGHYEGTSSNNSSSSSSLTDAPGAAARPTDSAPASTATAPRRGASIPYTPPVSSSKESTPPSGNSSSSEKTPSGSPTDAGFSHRSNAGPSRSILKNRSSNSGAPSTSPETQTSYFVAPTNTSAAHTSSNTSMNAAPSGAASQAFLPPVSGSTGHTPISQLPVSAHASSEENTTRGRTSTRSASSTSLSDRVPSRSGSGASLSPSVSNASPTTATGPSPVSPASTSAGSAAATGRGARPPSIKTVNVAGQPLKPASSEDGGSDGRSPKSGEGFWADGDEKRDDEGKDESYKYAESTNPTPNSSPLISMRNLSLDSSAASLPHAQSKPATPPTGQNPATAPGAPAPIQPTTTNPGGAASVASPASATSSLQRTTSNNSSGPFATGDDKDAAANGKAGPTGVVATARDLLGALWGMAGEGAKKAA